jgi:hypothetical protein
MKAALRLAQSRFHQAIEQMGFLSGFSSLPEADSGAAEKRDSSKLLDLPRA